MSTTSPPTDRRSDPITNPRAWYLEELAGMVQLPRLILRTPGLALQPRGHSQPVVVLPGHGFGDGTTLPLRSYLRYLGYDVRGWGLGPNRDHARVSVPPIIESLERIMGEHGQATALVGQSLGGYVAREVTRRRPDLVSQVITLGSPIFGRLSNGEIERPVTALFSRTDGIVPVGQSMATDKATTNVEVRSTHFAMGIDPDIWKLIARLLAGEAATAQKEPRTTR